VGNGQKGPGRVWVIGFGRGALWLTGLLLIPGGVKKRGYWRRLPGLGRGSWPRIWEKGPFWGVGPKKGNG